MGGVSGFEEGVKELGGKLAQKDEVEFQTQYGSGEPQVYGDEFGRGHFYNATDCADAVED